MLGVLISLAGSIWKQSPRSLELNASANTVH